MSSPGMDELDRHLLDLVREDRSLDPDVLAALLPLVGDRSLAAFLGEHGVLRGDAERKLDMMRRGYLRGTAGELLVEAGAAARLAELAAAVPRVAPQQVAPATAPGLAPGSLPLAEDSLEYYFTLAGNTDSISVPEIVQLFSTGRHTGCLSLESPQTTMHVHLQNGVVRLVDPLQVRRRVYHVDGHSQPFTIPLDVLERAVAVRRETRRPILLGLLAEGAIDARQLRRIAEPMAAESLFLLLCNPDPVFFMFRPHVELPDGAAALDLKIDGISLLLEASRMVDERRRLTASWPGDGARIVPAGNLLTRVADLDVRREDMRFLAAIESGSNIGELAHVTGLPLIDIYGKVAEFLAAGVLLLEATNTDE
ncbi:MAG: DUF4388 domain-containing protein [Planctomycetes bacterium]|nr:DUF4388 domain-containing protein [Planctomycetota bacterium]